MTPRETLAKEIGELVMQLHEKNAEIERLKAENETLKDQTKP